MGLFNSKPTKPDDKFIHENCQKYVSNMFKIYNEKSGFAFPFSYSRIYFENKENKFKLNDFLDTEYHFIVGIQVEDPINVKYKIDHNEYTDHIDNTSTIMVCNIIPIFKIKTLEIEINFTDKESQIYFIMGKCVRSIYEYLSQENVGIKNTFIYNNYYQSIVYNDTASLVIILPHVYTFCEKYRKYLAQKTSDMIRDELLEVVMHPDNLFLFLSVDEVKQYLPFKNNKEL